MDYIEVSAKTIEEATSQATAQIESQGRVVKVGGQAVLGRQRRTATPWLTE